MSQKISKNECIRQHGSNNWRFYLTNRIGIILCLIDCALLNMRLRRAAAVRSSILRHPGGDITTWLLFLDSISIEWPQMSSKWLSHSSHANILFIQGKNFLHADLTFLKSALIDVVPTVTSGFKLRILDFEPLTLHLGYCLPKMCMCGWY